MKWVIIVILNIFAWTCIYAFIWINSIARWVEQNISSKNETWWDFFRNLLRDIVIFLFFGIILLGATGVYIMDVLLCGSLFVDYGGDVGALAFIVLMVLFFLPIYFAIQAIKTEGESK